MGFNKGIINEEKIKDRFHNSGVEGIKKWLRSYDAFYIKDNFSSEIVKSFNQGRLDNNRYLNIYLWWEEISYKNLEK